MKLNEREHEVSNRREPSKLSKLSQRQLRLLENDIIYIRGGNGEKIAVLSEAAHQAFLERLSPGGFTPAKALSSYRLREGLTQKQLAKRTGISQPNISAMEKGKRPIGLNVAKKLAKALNCRYQRLV